MTNASATIGGQDNATITFTRTGSTASAMVVKFALSGTAVKWLDYRRPEGDMPVEITISAGAASATMTIVGVANVTGTGNENVMFTLLPDAAYTIGTAANAVITIH